MTEFSEKSLSALGDFYVYGLIDPRSKLVFYIGKGKGNRVFQHELESLNSPDSEKLKLKTIAEIKADGKEVEKIIFNCNLTENEAFAAEAALINAFNYLSDAGLSNEASGHHFHKAHSVEEFERLYGAEALKKEDIKHNLLIIKVNRFYNRKMTPKEIYDAVRGAWWVSSYNAKRVDYVLGVYHSLVVGVYKPDEWYEFGLNRELVPEHSKDIEVTDSNKKKKYFVDSDYEVLDENKQIYYGKTIEDIGYNAKAQNPITYYWNQER